MDFSGSIPLSLKKLATDLFKNLGSYAESVKNYMDLPMSVAFDHVRNMQSRRLGQALVGRNKPVHPRNVISPKIQDQSRAQFSHVGGGFYKTANFSTGQCVLNSSLHTEVLKVLISMLRKSFTS